MERRLLIIGAGKYQVPGICKAKEMGIYTISVDGNKHAEGSAISDEFYHIDIKDVKSIERLAREREVNGVISFASEVALPIAAQISDDLGFNFIDLATARRATDKSLQREIFQQKGVFSPKFLVIEEVKELNTVVEILNFPVIIKPIDNSGSRGVFKIEDKRQLFMFYEQAKRYSPRGKVLVEEFIGGVEYAIEAFANYDGSVIILGIAQKAKPENSFRVATELGYNCPLPQKTYESICHVVTQAVQSLEIKNTITHTEVIVKENSQIPYLVETAARSGGFGIFHKIIPFVSGIDIVEKMILAAFGEKIKINPVDVTKKGAVLKFFAAEPGQLEEIIIQKYTHLTGDDYEFGFFKSIGDEIRELSSDGERTGYIITLADMYADAVERANDIYNNVSFKVRRNVN